MEELGTRSEGTGMEDMTNIPGMGQRFRALYGFSDKSRRTPARLTSGSRNTTHGHPGARVHL